MENNINNNNFKTVAALVKDSLGLDAVVHLIMDNAELNYNGKELKISNENTVLQFIKYLYPKLYDDKLNELKTKE